VGPLFDAVDGSTHRYASAVEEGAVNAHRGLEALKRRYSAEFCTARRTALLSRSKKDVWRRQVGIKKCRRGQARGAKNKENKRGNAAQTTAFRYLGKAKSV